MITYVDTSTLIKLIVDEEGSDRAELIWQSAESVASASLIVVEARAALAAAAAARVDRLSADQLLVAEAIHGPNMPGLAVLKERYDEVDVDLLAHSDGATLTLR